MRVSLSPLGFGELPLQVGPLAGRRCPSKLAERQSFGKSYTESLQRITFNPAANFANGLSVTRCAIRITMRMVRPINPLKFCRISAQGRRARHPAGRACGRCPARVASNGNGNPAPTMNPGRRAAGRSGGAAAYAEAAAGANGARQRPHQWLHFTLRAI